MFVKVMHLMLNPARLQADRYHLTTTNWIISWQAALTVPAFPPDTCCSISFQSLSAQGGMCAALLALWSCFLAKHNASARFFYGLHPPFGGVFLALCLDCLDTHWMRPRICDTDNGGFHFFPLENCTLPLTAILNAVLGITRKKKAVWWTWNYSPHPMGGGA